MARGNSVTGPVVRRTTQLDPITNPAPTPTTAAMLSRSHAAILGTTSLQMRSKMKLSANALNTSPSGGRNAESSAIAANCHNRRKTPNLATSTKDASPLHRLWPGANGARGAPRS